MFATPEGFRRMERFLMTNSVKCLSGLKKTLCDRVLDAYVVGCNVQVMLQCV